MNLEELKVTWQEYDQKLKATKSINEKIILNMIRDRSGSILSVMRRNGLLTIVLMAVIIWFCMMSIIYNAFDFEYKLQFLPLVIYVVVAVIFIIYLIKAYINSQVDLYKDNLKESLIKVIATHEKFMSVNLKLGMMFLFAAFLYLLSASFKTFQNEGILKGLIFFAGGIIVNVTLLYVAKLMGAFKDHYGNKLKSQLKELEDFEEERKHS
ncbi:MAG TPA: hypothetical protein VD908_08075 [Cytophagales bacterium]|nr:hypothetical protein [Cytophagales bacterium]